MFTISGRAPRAAGLVLTLAVAPAALEAQDLLVHGGTVVTAEGRFAADVLVRDGTVARLGVGLTAEAGVRRVDASGLLVMPGGVDPHVHLGGNWVDDYRTGSMAALAGGITTISNFAFAGQGASATALVAREAGLIERQAIADVILHVTIADPAIQAAQMSALAATGQRSVKFFMNFDFFDPNAADFMRTMEAAGEAGVLTMVHAEDAAIIEHAVGELTALGRTSIRYLADARPPLAEEVAMRRAVAMADRTGAPVYAVHVSSEGALGVAREARASGLDFYVETRPIYLHLTRERFEGADAGIYVGQPPLREQSDQDALWEGLANGTVQVVATDHVAYSREDKLDPSQTIARHRAGMNHLQMLRPMLWSEGVREGRITAERFVAVTSTNPAKLFGLHPEKGTIAVGSDADVVLWDPDETRVVRDGDMLSATGFSIYAGRSVTGWPVATIRRGEIVYEEGRITADPGSGRLLERRRWAGL